MSALFPPLPVTRSLRASLKRGLARAAFTGAARASADVAGAVAALRAMPLNTKGQDRILARLARAAGVVKVARGEHGAVAILRTAMRCTTRAEAVDLFAEDTVIYLRLTFEVRRKTMFRTVTSASFSRHALERLVERGEVPLSSPLLPVLDAEAVALLRRLAAGDVLAGDGEDQVRARAEGVWAGAMDRACPDPAWGLSDTAEARLPMFSARTFLSPDQMDPVMWLRWKDDPQVRVS